MADYTNQILDPVIREALRNLIARVEKLENPEKEVVNRRLSPAELHIETAFKKRVKVIGD